MADASQRAQRGEAPLDAWKCVIHADVEVLNHDADLPAVRSDTHRRGGDPELAIAAAMIPKLQAHLETVRDARESVGANKAIDSPPSVADAI